jgi:hypothetical protein
MNWTEACRILGIPESATDVDIKEQYIYKAQLLHPDKNQDKPENVRKKAEAELALVNQAFTFISNPINNPYKVPPMLSIEPQGIRFKDVTIGERKVTTLTISNVGGPYTSVWIDNQPAPWLNIIEVKSITSERLPLEVIIQCTGTGEPDKLYSCGLSIKLENENTHTVDQKTVPIEMYTMSKVANPLTGKVVAPPLKTQADYSPTTYSSPPDAKTSNDSSNSWGFSTKTFLLNVLAFGGLGIVVFYFVFTYWKTDVSIFMIAVTIYSVMAFGFSLNHAINVGSKRNKTPK